MLAEQADRLVGGQDAVPVVDDMGHPKKGTASVGVAPQSCGEVGKTANCQVLVSLTLARGEVPAGQAPGAEPAATSGGRDAGDAALASHHLAERHQRLPRRSLRCRAGAGDGRTDHNADTPRLPSEGWAAKRTDGLIGEWRDSGATKYYLSNLPKQTSLRRLAATVKARWSCEQVHQQLKRGLSREAA